MVDANGAVKFGVDADEYSMLALALRTSFGSNVDDIAKRQRQVERAVARTRTNRCGANGDRREVGSGYRAAS